MRSTFLMATLFASLLACGDDDPKCADLDCGGGETDAGHDGDGHTDEEVAVGPASGAPCPEGSALTYETFAKDFFANYCLSCHSQAVAGADRHGAPSDHNFDTVEQIRRQAAHIDEVAAAGPKATNTAMPEGDETPSEDERKKLGEWLACGAP